MNAGSQPHRTRVWWDNGEVVFIRWTEKTLVFSWGDVRETAVHIPRGAVTRLVQKGVLRVEGEAPTWIQPNFAGAQVVPVSPPTPVVPVPAPVEADNGAFPHPFPRCTGNPLTSVETSSKGGCARLDAAHFRLAVSLT